MRLFRDILLALLLAVMLTASAGAETCCQGRVGDVNGSGDEPTVSDIGWLVANMFQYSCELPPEWIDDFCMAEADVNQSGGLNPTCEDITISDIGVLISYLFINGPYDPITNPTGTILPDCLEQTNDPYGYLVSTGDCKTRGALSEETSFATTCINYTYDGIGTLTLTHVNAGLNCCPVPTLTVAIEDDVITITESDEGVCNCLCLYDIQYQIENLPPGEYRIVVVEAMPGGGDQLDFTANLTYEHTDQFCVARYGYPWSYEAAAVVTAHSGCLSGSSAAQSATAPLDQSCISYAYDIESQVLSITHANAAFNCCPGYFGVAVSVEGNTVTITETDELGLLGCHCLCLYDFSYDVVNLPPGEYSFVIQEPYTETGSELTFTANLIRTPVNDVCVDRDYYPWGYYDASR